MWQLQEGCTMSIANKYERYMLRLINEDRAELGLRPMKLNGDLNTASERHSQWMLDKDIFSHTGAGGSTHTARMQAAGYDLKGSWATGENIGLQSKNDHGRLWDEVRDIYRNLMNSPDHRANMMSATFTEIGIGIEQGSFRSGGNTFESVMVTQDFGKTSSRAQQAAKADTFEFEVADRGSEDSGQVGTLAMRNASVPMRDDVIIDEVSMSAIHAFADWSMLV
jgi:uncharacterized protein YkwD